MVKIYSSQNSALVHNLKNVLLDNGIECEVRGEARIAGLGELPPTECWPELWITDDSQEKQAREIVEASANETESTKESWMCPKCGEESEGQFAVCWNCGAERPATSA